VRGNRGDHCPQFFCGGLVSFRKDLRNSGKSPENVSIEYDCNLTTIKGEVGVEIITDRQGFRTSADAKWTHSVVYTRFEPREVILYPDTWMGFYRERLDRKNLYPGNWFRAKEIVFPVYVPLLVFGVLPGVWLRNALRRRSRNRLGFCLACGYDLRATPGRCPECGAEPTGPK
jgi:hypothetical protein